MPITIYSQPTFEATRSGGSASFAVGATGPWSLSYQWVKYHSGVTGAVAGATGYNLSLYNLSTADNGSEYYAQIGCTGQAGVQSVPALLTVVSSIPANGGYGSGYYAEAGYKVGGVTGIPELSPGLHYQAMLKLWPVRGFADVK